MDKYVFDIDKFGAHVFPFLWVHGEDNSIIRNEISAIRDTGIKMFCVESRPHPEFCEGEKWWKDFGYILSVAKEFGMKVWLLDDKHFPTGYAVGAVEKEPRLKQKNIRALNFVLPKEPGQVFEVSRIADVFIKGFDKSEYSYIGKRDYVTDIREEEGLRDFCGTVRYELEFDYFLTFKKVLLDFGKNENAIKIVVNGIDCGFIYGAPYCADITNALKRGKNTLSIELSTTLALHYKDMFSKYCKIPKCGMLNAIELKCFSD